MRCVLAELSLCVERAAAIALLWGAAFLAGQAIRAYCAAPGPADGRSRAALPGLRIGARAVVAGLRLLTRDAGRYRHDFPRLDIICP
ncbi:hypothetical protein [Pseudorhodoferax sp. Leaf274]|uniref:hypothetical protein n=1 Tax=Pseudorhodoferax sp. Leaf274 TaxID=1736318 RepID=UPI000702BFA3|nr:hypothetical protein [Pseudorhodoferax sp. Leaf274]KQP38837.1 hypothetical protein ASF44_10345 [Pseudorhodoferax sp. Leaf274]